ncbi:hypothetical protein Vretifemale_16159, partial [Volvox reticuliferus]
MLRGTRPEVTPVRGRSRPALPCLILWLLAYSFSSGISALQQHGEEAEAGIPSWLHRLVSPSKAAWQNLDVYDSLSGLTMAFPIWFAGTDQVSSAFSVAGEDGSASGLGFGRTPNGLSPQLLELDSLENIRSAQRLEDAVVAFLAEMAVQVQDESGIGPMGANAGGGKKVAYDGIPGGASRVSATLLGIRQRLESEVKQLAAIMEGRDPKPSRDAGGGGDAGRSDGGEKSSGKDGDGAAGRNAGRHEAGHADAQKLVGALQDGLGHLLADGLAGWLQHAATHPLPDGSSMRLGGGGRGIEVQGAPIAEADSPPPAGTKPAPPEAHAEIKARLQVGSNTAVGLEDRSSAVGANTGDLQQPAGLSRADETAGGERVSATVGRRRLQQSSGGGSGNDNG